MSPWFHSLSLWLKSTIPGLVTLSAIGVFVSWLLKLLFRWAVARWTVPIVKTVVRFLLRRFFPALARDLLWTVLLLDAKQPGIAATYVGWVSNDATRALVWTALLTGFALVRGAAHGFGFDWTFAILASASLVSQSRQKGRIWQRG